MTQLTTTLLLAALHPVHQEQASGVCNLHLQAQSLLSKRQVLEFVVTVKHFEHADKVLLQYSCCCMEAVLVIVVKAVCVILQEDL